jgi:virulence factor Mce-like protein
VNVPKLAGRLGLLLAAVVLAVILLGGGNDYVIHLQMGDALGLRDGSKVVEGGVQVGTVGVRIGGGDRVITTVNIQRQYAPIGRNATAQVVSVNLLGQKSLQLQPGNHDDPAPNGFTIPASRVTPSTDLDQVLNVLGPDTRARLTILLNEAGAAFAGRRLDFSRLLAELPSSLTQGTALLDQLVQNNHTLADLVTNSDQFITTVDTQRTQLGNLVATLGQTANTVQARDAQLQSTLRQLPGTLGTAQVFLRDLRQTTVPLGPAAQDLQRVAPPLQSVLDQLSPFAQAARPTLAKAIGTAPALTRLADGATPVLRVAAPTLSTLHTTSIDLIPVSHALSLSVDNIIATATNWSHAIELRDALGHVFRAEVAITAQTAKELVNRLLSSPAVSKTPARAEHHAPAPAQGAAKPVPPAPAVIAPPHAAGSTSNPVSSVLGGVSKLLGGLTGGPGSPLGGSVSNLLKYLLKP